MSTVRNVMNRLYCAAKDNMSADELREIGDAMTEIAAGHAVDMSDVCDGIACLVASDAEAKSSAGSFQDGRGVFSLLVAIGREFDVIAGLIETGTEATWKAGQIEQQGSTSE